MDKRYYAFISYKREDEKQAKWLQDKLEHYRFPTNLNGRTDLPKNVRPIFRDVTDLTPGILAEEINKALNDSQWLIIVCSPRSAKSPWVCKEAQSFIDSGRADRIIPYVIEGVPFSGDEATECYPEALLNMKGNKELLAANVNEIGREAAAIKILARMFGLRFDTLWQRYEREQRRKRWMWGILSVFLILAIAFIIACFYKSNRDLLITQSLNLASEAQNEYNSGNITKALRVALYALPQNQESLDRPYVVEAEQMLRKSDKPMIEETYSYGLIKDGISYNYRKKPIFHGRKIYTESKNKIHVWDAISHRRIDESPLFENISEFSLDPNGKLALVSSTKSTKVYDISNWKLINEFPGLAIYSQFSPNGKYVFIQNTSKLLNMYDVYKKGESKEFTLPHYRRVVVGPDSNSFLTFKDSLVYVYDVSVDNQNHMLLIRLEHKIFSAVFSPNGKYILIVSRDNVARVLNATTGKPITELLRHNANINSAVFSPDGKYIVTASADSTACVWDAMTGELITEPLLHDGKIKFAEFSPNGKFILTCSDDNVINLWHALIGKQDMKPFAIQNNVEDIGFTIDCKGFYTITSDNSIRIWKTNALGSPNKYLSKIIDFVPCYNSPNNAYFITKYKKGVIVVDATTGKNMTDPLPHKYWVKHAIFSPDGKNLVTTDGERMYVWDWANNKLVIPPIKLESKINSFIFDSKGERLFVVEDSSIFVYDSNTWKPFSKSLKYDEVIKAVSISPDGEKAITLLEDETYVWNTETLENIKGLKLAFGVNNPVFNRKGNQLYYNSSYGQFISPLDKGNPLMLNDSCFYAKKIGSSIMFNDFISFDGKHILLPKSSGYGFNIYDFNDNDFFANKPLEPESAIFSYETTSIICYATLSHNGKYVAVSENNIISVWDIMNKKMLIEPVEHSCNVEQVSFDYNDRYIYIYDNMNNVSVLSFPPLQELIDKYLNDPEHDWSLTDEEKAEYSLE